MRLVVVSISEKLIHIDIKDKPCSGVLMDNEGQLIIGCLFGDLCKFNIKNPIKPFLENSVKLGFFVKSLLKLSEDALLCGDYSGSLNIVLAKTG